MSLKYYLKDNKLTPDPDDYLAVTVKGKTNDLEDIVDVMMHRPVGVSRVETMGVLEELFIALEFLLKRGESVVTPLFKITPIVSGVFEGQQAAFDASKHRVRISMSPGLRMGRIAAEIAVERVSHSIRLPELIELMDMASGLKNQSLSPGQPARLLGDKLKFEEADPLQGVFLVNQGDGSESKVSFVLDNRPKTITFIVPDGLPTGTYQLELRSTMGAKELRTGTLEAELSVS